jgi:hypothetical protein
MTDQRSGDDRNPRDRSLGKKPFFPIFDVNVPMPAGTAVPRREEPRARHVEGIEVPPPSDPGS